MSELAVNPPRTRRDPRRAATRERLLVAALAIVREKGSGAVTKAAICQRAGLHRSGFYGYFKDVDECMTAAADRVIQAQRTRDARAYEVTAAGAVEGRTGTIRLVREVLDVHATDRDAMEIAVRCGGEDSIIGAALREERNRNTERIARDYWMIAVRQGLTDRDPPELRVLADIVLHMIESAIEFVFRNEDADLDLIATTLGNATHFAVVGQIRTLIKEQSPAES